MWVSIEFQISKIANADLSKLQRVTGPAHRLYIKLYGGGLFRTSELNVQL